MHVMCVADCEEETEEEGRAPRSAAVFNQGEQQSLLFKHFNHLLQFAFDTL